MSKVYFVYIMASGQNGTLYIGVTNDIGRRAWEHHEGLVEGFTRKYGVKLLVWYEVHDDVRDAIKRETLLKVARLAPDIEQLNRFIWMARFCGP